MTEYCSECRTTYRTTDGRVVHDRGCPHWSPPEVPPPGRSKTPEAAARGFDTYIFIGAYVPLAEIPAVTAAIAKARGWSA